MNLSTQLLALVQMLRSSLPILNVVTKTELLLSYSRCARSGCHPWVPFITVAIQAHPSLLPEHKLYQNLTYSPHAARGYRVKLQRQIYGTTLRQKIIGARVSEPHTCEFNGRISLRYVYRHMLIYIVRMSNARIYARRVRTMYA